ncbi:hypothetical protein [Frankia sp. Cr2]|uniref:DNA-3-methyladenine glycosylase family protein n=1 Tax=Frankia sp. Cr2 TaxID=3073932 RepID=UPI002AD387EE|nr:hypothetical protein [Frankia sp. Cr2]
MSVTSSRMTPPKGGRMDAGELLYVPVRAPFSWDHSLRFICGFPATQGEQEVVEGRLLKAWRFLDRSVVTQIGPGSDDSWIEVAIASSGPVTDELRAMVADRVTFYLSLDDDLSELAGVAAGDPAFAAVEARMRGYHQVKFPTPQENIVWAILAQRTPLPVARKAKLRLMHHVNPPVSGFGVELQPFPSLPQLAALSLEDFAELVGHSRKAGYLFGSVQKLAQVDESFLRAGACDEVERFLLSLPGIGRWSATFVMIRGLGRMELLPDDAELLKAVHRVYGEPPPGDLATLSARYAPNQGYWAHYLRAVQ